MKKTSQKFTSHGGYFKGASKETRLLLQSIQKQVKTLIPQASPCISYNIPAFRDGRVFFYFAAFKKHIGVYPPVQGDKKLIKKLKAYRNEKGNLSFPLDHPLPLELIGRVAVALHDEYARK